MSREVTLIAPGDLRETANRLGMADLEVGVLHINPVG